MARMRSPVGIVFIASLLMIPLFSGFLGRPAFGQEASKSAGARREPLSRWSKQWLDEVVPYIISRAEKDVFLSLPNEEERGRFIAAFWKKRDPDPGTEENEFKLVYYRRIALANKFFGAAGMDGWRTDRGKICILLGPPDEIRTNLNPSDSSSSVFPGPRETWSYWGLPGPGLPYNLEFTFVDRTGTGHYALDKGLDLAGQKGSPLDPDSLHHYFDYQEYLAEATRNPFENLDRLRGIVTTQVSYDRLPIQVECQTLKKAGGQTGVALVVRIPPDSVEGKTIEGRRYFSFTLLIKVSDESGRSLSETSKDFNFRRPLDAAAGTPGSRDGTFELRQALDLKPGSYQLHLLVLDNFTGRAGTSAQEISVPDFGLKN